MRKATMDDRTEVVNVLYRSYRENPSVLWTIKQDNNLDQRVRLLCEYCFDTICPIGGVYITSNGHGISMFYNLNDLKFSIRGLLQKIKFVLKVTGIKRGIDIAKREAYIKKHRPKGNYLYFWMLAVDPGSLTGFKTMQEIRDEIFAISSNLNLPIYCETTVERNLALYERSGFETYYKWEMPSGELTVWFMRKMPEQGYRRPIE